MPLYGGIDLHANNRVVVLLNEQDQVIYQKRLPNHLPTIVRGRVLWHLGYSDVAHWCFDDTHMQGIGIAI